MRTDDERKMWIEEVARNLGVSPDKVTMNDENGNQYKLDDNGNVCILEGTD